MATQPSGLVDGSGGIRDSLSGRGRDFRDHHGACQGRAGARLQKRVREPAASLGDYFRPAGRI